MENYENNEELKKVKIESISHLATLMVGTGDEGHCIYDQNKKQWTPGGFLPSPKGIFDWESINGQGEGNTDDSNEGVKKTRSNNRKPTSDHPECNWDWGENVSKMVQV